MMHLRLTALLLASSLIGSTIAFSKSGCTAACNTLQSVFILQGEHIVSGINGTSNLTTTFWSAQQGAVVPSCYITPQSVSDVIVILQTVENHGCGFAIKSGGHTPFAGASNIADGITLDLSLINDITTSADRQSVVVGTGAIWNDVYSKLDPQGLTVVGARCGEVGIGGFLLGGGISPFSSLHGFGCDNVLSYEVVINDKILHASADQHSDLYFALRGGSSNFGIVTHVTLATYQHGNMWGGFRLYNTPQFAALIDAMVNLTYQSPLYPKAATLLTFQYNSTDNNWMGIAQFEYFDAVVNPPIFHNYTSIPSTLSTLSITTMGAMAKAVHDLDVFGKQQTFWTFTYKHDPIFPHTIWTQCQYDVDAFIKVHKISGFVLACKFFPLTVPFLQHGSDRGNGNAFGLSPEAPLIIFVLEIFWDNAADQDVVFDFSQQFIIKANATAHNMGLGHPFVYLNTAAVQENPFYGYGATNLASLRAISQTYDKQQTFQILQPGGFKL